ncbi:hypothetical protein ACFPPB_20395 [Rhodanobacter terrae]|uniref:Uncharacterized protein n=1 Tax=Rhodanobacter terrae TaxID=418647 RepID=A0ABW0T2C0_9GAMM
MTSITIMALEAERGGSLFLLVQGGRLRRRLTPALGGIGKNGWWFLLRRVQRLFVSRLRTPLITIDGIGKFTASTHVSLPPRNHCS